MAEDCWVKRRGMRIFDPLLDPDFESTDEISWSEEGFPGFDDPVDDEDDARENAAEEDAAERVAAAQRVEDEIKGVETE